MRKVEAKHKSDEVDHKEKIRELQASVKLKDEQV